MSTQDERDRRGDARVEDEQDQREDTRPEEERDRPEDTPLEDEVFDERPGPAAEAPTQEWPADDRPRRAPRVFTVLLGLVCLTVAGVAFASEFADLSFDWSGGGPFVVIAAGVVIAVLGVVGIQTSRGD